MPHPFLVLRVFCVPDGSAGKGCGLRSRLQTNPRGPPLPSRLEIAGVLDRSRRAPILFVGALPSILKQSQHLLEGLVSPTAADQRACVRRP